VLVDVIAREDRTARHVLAVERLEPLGGGPRPEHLRHQLEPRGGVRDQARPWSGSAVLEPLRLADRAAEALELAVRDRRRDHVSVLRLEHEVAPRHRRILRPSPMNV
jgi:hypothetical protein